MKEKFELSLDLQMDYPIIDPGNVRRPFENPRTDFVIQIPGTTVREPSTKPKDALRDKPTGIRAHTALYDIIEHYSFGPGHEEVYSGARISHPGHY